MTVTAAPQISQARMLIIMWIALNQNTLYVLQDLPKARPAERRNFATQIPEYSAQISCKSWLGLAHTVTGTQNRIKEGSHLLPRLCEEVHLLGSEVQVPHDPKAELIQRPALL